ncbi:MAG: glycosyltransferase family 4 protein [Actinomycetota bacterium]|nr:glycosyltransferase family 4 protein [Actinomycetota bacterium]
MRIAVVKPDHGTVGGFELVVRRVVRHLRSVGHEVRIVTVRADLDPDRALGRPVPDELRRRAPEFVDYLGLVATFRAVDLSGEDLVISTQPGSFAVRHERHLALFYHHYRLFYEFAPLLASAGLVRDPDLHLELASVVRELDDECLAGVGRFCVPSRTVADRLDRYNGIDRVSPFHAGIGLAATAEPAERPGPGEHVLCVSRHEFPKRTELFAAAARGFGELPAVCVGAGSRIDWVRRIDELARSTTDVEPERLWRARNHGDPPLPGRSPAGIVRFVSYATHAELAGLYRRATCVVAPALDEDYGLTVIEAMAHGVPVVVCDDGGSLVELTEDAGAGLVVEPTPEAIAAGVRRLSEDRDLATRCREAAREAGRTFTWSRAFGQLDAAVAAVADA